MLPCSNGNEGVFHIPQIYKTGASPSDGLVSYPKHSLGVGGLPLCRDTVDVFYSLNWMGCLAV